MGARLVLSWLHILERAGSAVISINLKCFPACVSHNSLQCPTENKETFGIHLRIVGDWTEHFAHLLLPQPRAALEILPVVHQRRYPTLYVDGPFGSPSEEVFNYDVSLCIAGGIGVTPFACVLDALIERWQSFRLQRLYFVWVCRELQSFYWFAELLCALHEKLWQDNRPDYLNVKLYVTQKDSLQVRIRKRLAHVDFCFINPVFVTKCITSRIN
uniref:Ferric reductase NAD binding domain-containing protein n=1 Tax=Oryzias sinensis TaxID=183150 RepID=A0A8C7YGG5_9TELE